MKIKALKMRILLVVFALFFIEISIAQTNRTIVTLHQDRRLETLNKFPNSKADSVFSYQRSVYRIMIDSIQNRQSAYQLKEKLFDAYKGQQVYISYKHPFFKVKLGDFLLMDSAEYFKKAIFTKFKFRAIVTYDIQQLRGIM